VAYESAYIPAPHGGIGQSAPQIRLITEAEVLADVIVDLPDGLRKRPPLTWLGRVLTATGSVSGRVHKIKDPDDGSVKFVVVNREGTATVPRIFDASMNSVAITSIASDAQAYLNNITNPKAGSRIAQGIDDTFFVNRNQVVGTTGTQPTRPFEGIIFVKSAAFGKNYQVSITPVGGSPINGNTVTPDGTDASDSFWADTDHILGAFIGLDAYTSANGATHTSAHAALITAGFTVTIQGPVAYLSHPTIDFTIATQDSQGGAALISAKLTVNAFSNLPATVPVDGFTVQVVPTRGDKQGAYWVRFNLTPSPGSWAEVVAPGADLGIDAATMPPALSKDGSGHWNIATPAWKQRAVGDQATNIDPLFIGDKLQDMGFAFGRLCLVSSEEAFMCAADDPFRIYSATMTTVIDSDPISLSPPTGEAQFQSIVTYGTDIFQAAFFTGLQQQLLMRAQGDGAVTVANSKMLKVSAYQLQPATQNLRPPSNNGRVYLPVPLDQFIGIREMHIDRYSGETLGEDLTASQPKLIPNGVDCAATIESNYSAIYGISGTNQLFYHIFRYNDNQRVQNGYFPMFLPSGYTLMDLAAEGTLLYVFAVSAGGDLHCFTMQMNPKSVDPLAGATIITKWDLKQAQTQIAGLGYNAALNQTTITSALDLPAGAAFVSAAIGAGPYPEGYLATVVSQVGRVVVVVGDWTAQVFYLGANYTGIWQPSTIFVRSPQDNMVMHSGKLTLKRLVADLLNASSLTVSVSVAERSLRTTDLKQNVLGSPTLYTGSLPVKLGGKNFQTTIQFLLDGHLGGATISGFEWFGDFVARSQRVS
jgi:hypothetical protein